MNENRIVRKGAVREMNRYWLHAASGELSLARDNGKNIEKESEPQIILLNMEEFQQLEGNYPHRKNLISSMRFIRYSKVEAFHECVQGIIHVPKQGSKKEKEFSFGFLQGMRQTSHGDCHSYNFFILILYDGQHLLVYQWEVSFDIHIHLFV